MAEFLVKMQLTFPATMAHDVKQRHYLAEARRARELADAGLFKRVWRIPGRTAHIALYDVPDVTVLHEILQSWPMFDYMDCEVIPLAINHNDPGGVAESLPDVAFTWDHLRTLVDVHHAYGDGGGYDLGEGISIHAHPGTERGEQVHVMCDGQKIAELGPPNPMGESIAPGYIDLLTEWMGRPVTHARWQQRILKDNGLLGMSYGEATRNSHFARHLIHGQ